MNRTNRDSFSAFVIASILAFLTPAFAQSGATEKAGAMHADHQRKVTVLAENEKMQVVDVLYEPGDTGAVSSKAGLVVYHLSPGTIERRFADGSKQVVIYKTGQAMIIDEKRPYSTKNIGKTAVHEIVFQPK